MECLSSFQKGTAKCSQGFFHHSTLRYTAFNFKKLSRIPNLRDQFYWQGPVNSGLLHYIVMAICVIVMFVYALMTLVRPAPNKDTVCKIKASSAALGLLSLVFSFFSFYGHVGIFETWGGSRLRSFIAEQKKSICDWCFWTSAPFGSNIDNAMKAITEASEGTATEVRADPEYENYTEGLEIYMKHMGNINNMSLEGLSIQFEVIKEFLQPLCNNNINITIGKWDFITVMDRVSTEYVLHGLMMSVWTIALSFYVMRVFFKKSKRMLISVSAFSAVTSVLWWVLAGILHMFLVGLSDVNIKQTDVVFSIINGVSENINRDMIAAFLECTAVTDLELVGDLKAVAAPIVLLYENLNMAITHGFSKFPPASRKISHILPLKVMLNLIGNLYGPCTSINEMAKGNCNSYKELFESSIGRPLCLYLYWSIYVSYISALILAFALMAIVMLSMTIKDSNAYVCFKRSSRRLSSDVSERKRKRCDDCGVSSVSSSPQIPPVQIQPLVNSPKKNRTCLETCPRRTEPPPKEPPIRQICPKTCMGNIKFRREAESPNQKKRYAGFFSRKEKSKPNKTEIRPEQQGTGDRKEPLQETAKPPPVEKKRNAHFASKLTRRGKSKPSKTAIQPKQQGTGDRKEPLQETAAPPPAEKQRASRLSRRTRKGGKKPGAIPAIPQQETGVIKEPLQRTNLKAADLPKGVFDVGQQIYDTAAKEFTDATFYYGRLRRGKQKKKGNSLKSKIDDIELNKKTKPRIYRPFGMEMISFVKRKRVERKVRKQTEAAN